MTGRRCLSADFKAKPTIDVNIERKHQVYHTRQRWMQSVVALPRPPPPEYALDIMDKRNLWAPWRMQYLETLQAQLDDAAKPASGRPSAEAGASGASFLIDYWKNPEHDEINGVIERNEHGFIVLNRYPYSNGHLLVALGEPRPRLLDYSPAQRTELWKLVDRATDLVERTLQCQGVNIGLNQGRAAGAGIPQHLHAHVLPRWAGDTNFMTTIGNVRVIPEALEHMYARYKKTIKSTPLGTV